MASFWAGLTILPVYLSSAVLMSILYMFIIKGLQPYLAKWEAADVKAGTDASKKTLCIRAARFVISLPRYGRENLRETLWWMEQYPGLEALCARKDVKATFKLLWLETESVGVFAVELPGDTFGLVGKTVFVFALVLTFGWAGSPGEYQLLATVAKLYHQSFRPNQEEWHTTVPARSKPNRRKKRGARAVACTQSYSGTCAFSVCFW